MISQQTIDTILDRADIVEVIGEYVKLSQKGVNYTGCCPFHEEKTPSFVVSRAKNRWHCFGACAEGGNVISFLMKQGLTYVESIEKLAKRYGVEITERKPATEQEKQATAKREAMLIANKLAAKFYQEALRSEEGLAARSYVESRWGADYCAEAGIGYAPKGWHGLVHFAKGTALSVDILVELGLLKRKEGREYDAYRNRVMIPIRDKYSNVVGFTARDLSGEENAPKYINSCTSDLYSKENSIFGIEIATRAGVKENNFYLVEGAPDVLKLQSLGVLNTVASLGTAWTDNQFKQLKKLATNLCFIPDADPKKVGEYAAGIKSVMKNGVRAIQCGFAVKVKELPNGENNTKNDPDSFINEKKQLYYMEEIDFILWYASKIFARCDGAEGISNAIGEITKLIACLENEATQDIYIKQLQDAHDYKAVWIKGIRIARRQGQVKDALDKSKGFDRDLYSKYGFYEARNCYYAMDGNGKESKWSNFVMYPLFHIKDNLSPKRLYQIKNANGQEEIVEFKQEDLISLAKFKHRVEGFGNYVWLATEKELTKLKMLLYEQTETAAEVTQLGWNKRGKFYAFGNGALTTSWQHTDEYGIIKLENGNNWYLPSSSKIYRDDVNLFQFERKFVHLNYQSISLHDYAQKMIDVSGDNAKIGICFLLAALFRDIIVDVQKGFPILNLFGPKGSGKSELGHALMSFFIIRNEPPNIINSTIAALADVVAQCSNALVHLDEFKNTIEIDKREFLKGLWDGTGRSRMNMDRDKKREITSVDCGVILSGQEMATADIALFSRLLYLTFDKSEFTSEQKRRYEDFVSYRNKGVTHLTLEILQHRARVEQGFRASYKQCMADLSERLAAEIVEDRILRNWLIPVAAYHTLRDVIDLPFEYRNLLDIAVKGIISQNKECKTNNELANFWNVVSYLQQDGEIFFESDYRIDSVSEFKSDKITTKATFATPKRILKIRKNRIFMLYKKFGKQVGDTVLPESSLTYYLENCNEYMGKAGAVRFKEIQRGSEVIATVTSTNGMRRFKSASTVTTAMCFDYDAIEAKYQINLKVDTEEYS